MEISDIDKTKCIYCEQPFQHSTRERKIKGTEAKEIRFIMGHPKCEQLNKRIMRTHKQIQKTQVKLSEMRMSLVGMKYEEFLNKHTNEEGKEEDEINDNDCIIAILKKKNIL